MGRLVEHSPLAFRDVLGGMPQVEIASHTYSHIQMKPFPHAPCNNTIDEIRRDVEKGSEVIRKIFGIDVIEGLCVPGNYYRGFQDRPDLQEMLSEIGFRYISSDGRGPRETIPAPFTQPYWYEKHRLLEIPHTGWHCNMLNCLMEEVTLWPPLPSTVLPPKKIENVTELLDAYRREFDYAYNNNLYYAPGLHPWSLFRFDPEISVVRSLLEWSRERSFPVMAYREVYQIYGKEI